MINKDKNVDTLDSILELYKKCKHQRKKNGEQFFEDFDLDFLYKVDSKTRIAEFMIRIVAIITISILLLGCSFGFVSAWRHISTALTQAKEARERLEMMRDIVGLDSAVELKFTEKQPNIVVLEAKIDPILIDQVTIAWDRGIKNEVLYQKTQVSSLMLSEPRKMETVISEHNYTLPDTGSRQVPVTINVKYIPEVIDAFPEYAESTHTTIIETFELSSDGIAHLVKDTNLQELVPEVTAAVLTLNDTNWELTNSKTATINIRNDTSTGFLIQELNLPNVGDYVNISHSIPGMSPANPTVSLQDITTIQLELMFNNGDVPITLETKLVDTSGRITGLTQNIRPSEQIQLIQIPITSLKGYFDINFFDMSQVQRFDIAFSRRIVSQAENSTIEIRRIEFLGARELPEYEIPRSLVVLSQVPLQANNWSTAESTEATIEIFNKDNILTCNVDLPLPESEDETLPWTNIETELTENNFSGLHLLEFEIIWDETDPITLEVKLCSSDEENTYGRQLRILPESDIQTINVEVTELRYYWSKIPTENPILDLSNLKKIGFGICRKAINQTDSGTLEIKSVKLIGVEDSK